MYDSVKEICMFPIINGSVSVVLTLMYSDFDGWIERPNALQVS